MAHAKTTARTDAERLAAENLLLVPYVISKFTKHYHYPATWDDFTAGLLAIYRAAELWDSSVAKFSTYAHSSIWRRLQSIRRKTAADRHESRKNDLFWELAGQPDRADGHEQDRRSKLACEKVLSLMSERESACVRMRFIDGLTDQEIADTQGCTKQRINQVILRAIQRVQRKLTKE
jgi:RNA polymerase sigma factor (sigma-70 family)